MRGQLRALKTFMSKNKESKEMNYIMTSKDNLRSSVKQKKDEGNI